MNGLKIQASNSTVKGLVINRFEDNGILISGSGATGNKVQGNHIGTNAAGNGALGNNLYGVQICAAASDNTVGGTASAAGNLIAYNNQDGVVIVGSAVGNSILSNSIFSNSGLSIDLAGGPEDFFGVTANDTDDPDTGANNLQNFPLVRSAARDSTTGVTTIHGTLNSNPSQTYPIQCFKADGDASNHGEGQNVLGETTTATDANGDSPTFTCTSSAVAVGDNVSVTATNSTTGDTSEFSQNVEVTSGS